MTAHGGSSPTRAPLEFAAATDSAAPNIITTENDYLDYVDASRRLLVPQHTKANGLQASLRVHKTIVEVGAGAVVTITHTWRARNTRMAPGALKDLSVSTAWLADLSRASTASVCIKKKRRVAGQTGTTI